MKRLLEYVIRFIGRVIGTLRAEKRQLVNRYFGTNERFDGNALEICAHVVDRLWDGDFYRTSLGHFDFFWMRDFGTVTEALVRLGHTDRVHHTLQWALHHYRRAGIVKLCIDKSGNVFNAPARSIDALPWLLHSIVVSRYPLNTAERRFLERQLRTYRRIFLDKKTGQLRRQSFGEMRDAVLYDRSAYAVSLVGRLAQCVEALDLRHAFAYRSSQYSQELLDYYWNGQYFKADRRTDAFSAECALFPFLLGGIDDAAKAISTFTFIEKRRLNYPYPLKYTDQPEAFRYRLGMGHVFMPNYAGTAIWSWHGAYYLQLLKRYHCPEYTEQHARFSRMIERHGTFPEMLSPDGSWYYSPIYRGDPGMIWAALYLVL